MDVLLARKAVSAAAPLACLWPKKHSRKQDFDDDDEAFAASLLLKLKRTFGEWRTAFSSRCWLQLGKSGSIARALTRRYDFEAFFFNPTNKGQCEALLPNVPRPPPRRSTRRPRNSEKEPLGSSSPACLWLAMEQGKSEAL